MDHTRYQLLARSTNIIASKNSMRRRVQVGRRRVRRQRGGLLGTLLMLAAAKKAADYVKKKLGKGRRRHRRRGGRSILSGNPYPVPPYYNPDLPYYRWKAEHERRGAPIRRI